MGARLGGTKLTFAIEGTGSCGAGLTSAVRRRDIGVIELMRNDRRERLLNGKSETLDAENAARAFLAGKAGAIPKTNDGTVEMIRVIKVAKDVAVKARTRLTPLGGGCGEEGDDLLADELGLLVDEGVGCIDLQETQAR